MDTKPAELEPKIIHLLLNHTKTIDHLMDCGISHELFSDQYKDLVSFIFNEYLSRGSKVTKDNFMYHLRSMGNTLEIPQKMSVFYECAVGATASPHDIEYLRAELVNRYVGRNVAKGMSAYTNSIEKLGAFNAANNLLDDIQHTVSLATCGRTRFTPMEQYKTEYIRNLKYLAEHPEIRVKCGIPEIDDTMGAGFKKQHLTLFVADVGCYKTTMMLNVALKVWNQGYPVLFIPIEMNLEDLSNRIVSNRTGISSNKFNFPDQMSPDEHKLIEEADIFNKPGFCVFDSEERCTVSQLRREIEKRAFMFKPKLVCVDYVAIMKSDARGKQRSDEIVGEILKDLRALGNKLDFHIMTVCQMGREAIKSLRDNGLDSVPDSTSLRGSHDYSADANTIYALMKRPGEENKVFMYTIKARDGIAGHTHELSVDPSTCRIKSLKDTTNITKAADVDRELSRPPEEILGAGRTGVVFSGSDLDDEDELLAS